MVPAVVTGDGPPPSTLFDERWDTFNRWIGRSSRASQAELDLREGRVILHLSDCHIPYLDEQALLAAVEANGDASEVVLGGDALNCGAFSRFIEGALDNPRDEFAQLTQVLQYLSERFPQVTCNLGNHPDRVRKYFANRIPPYMMFLVQTNPIAFVIEGLRAERGIHNITIASSVIADTATANWLTFKGKTAFTHAETHGKLSTRPAENAARWLRKWQRHLDLWPDCVIQEHNHRGAKVFDEELGALLIQAPCLSKNQDYQTESRIIYSPNQIGWVRVVQHADGSINENATNYFMARGRTVIDGSEAA